QVHAKHHDLEHRVVTSQVGEVQFPRLQLMADIARAEDAGGEADQGIEHDEDDVQIVHGKVTVRSRMSQEERHRGQKGEKAGSDVYPCRKTVTWQNSQKCCRNRRQRQNQPQARGGTDHWRSPRNWSIAATSTVSKRSRIRNRKMPITMKAIRIEKATLISTTSGMPVAPVAASTRPFSSDMKPMTWLTALRLVTIMSRPSSRTDSAKARSSRATRSACGVAFSITAIERPASP